MTCLIEEEENGIKENCSKSIPIILNKIEINFYPEGGELISNIECGLYIESKNERNEFIDIIGSLIDSNNLEILKIKTLHEGRLKIKIKPKENEKYFLKIDEPIGLKNERFELPKSKSTGISMISLKNCFESFEMIEFKVISRFQQQ